MACVTKFDQSAVSNFLRHLNRTIANPSNTDIDPSQSIYNYSLLPFREISDYDFFLQRKSEVYCYGRKDVKVLASWVISAPADLAPEQERFFFKTVSDFLLDRYGENNAVSSIVHVDELGKHHLHFAFLPITEDFRHGGEKICANEVLTPTELRSFHPSLQKCLNEAGIPCHVTSGITQEIGGSVSVEDLKKAEKLIEIKRERERGFTW